MNLARRKRSAMLLLAAGMVLTACNDAWDEHYSIQDTGKSDAGLMDYIASRSDLSLFEGMLRQTGYDSLLSRSQAYTVFAPTDEALSSVPALLVDTANWKSLVSNHIAGYARSVSQSDSLTLTMLNGKRLLYARHGSQVALDGVSVAEPDLATRNGLLQVMDGYLPFRYNHWEYIRNAPGLDSLRTYVSSLDTTYLDEAASYDNEVFVDSIFRTDNPILDELAHLNLEDSIYTSILPDNEAWGAAYQRISPYFKTLDVDGGASAQRANTLWCMVRDLFYRGRIEPPVSTESLYSTNLDRMKNPDTLFLGAEKVRLSNGFGYRTSSLNYRPEETWCPEIRIEAETAFTGRVKNDFYKYYDLSVMSSLGTNYSLSGGYYLYCKSTASSALTDLTLLFPIPNTLSTQYNVYMVFVPTVITDTTDKRPYKVQFEFSTNYNTLKGVPVWTKRVLTNNITDPTKVTKLLVAQNYVFPTATVMSGYGMSRVKTTESKDASKPTFAIRLKNLGGVSAIEKATYNRDLRIDCIILEPVAP